jgi:hypothetical protein
MRPFKYKKLLNSKEYIPERLIYPASSENMTAHATPTESTTSWLLSKTSVLKSVCTRQRRLKRQSSFYTDHEEEATSTQSTTSTD